MNRETAVPPAGVVVAARAFVLATGHRAVIGSLDRIEELIAGTAGTQVCTEVAGGGDTL